MIERKYRCDLCRDEYTDMSRLIPIAWERAFGPGPFHRGPDQSERHLCMSCLSSAAKLYEEETAVNNDAMPQVP